MKTALASAALRVALGVLALTGCTGAAADDPSTAASATGGPDARTEALWAGRTAYVGDNSKVIALVDQAGFGPLGTYTLSLWTTRPPYAVTIDLPHPAKPFEQTDFSEAATILLGTVSNLDAVHVTSQGKTYSLTAREATATLGRDVKTLGTDRQALADYLRSHED
ncbi:hypothetical protein GCM10009740_07320 [Terrabacter terrae]|uniref:DUF4825 domain-containing protein n=2 Tax=Terrabacter terrae TaxID=318434 RepID=A0ABP5F9B4_9MICO